MKIKMTFTILIVTALLLAPAKAGPLNPRTIVFSLDDLPIQPSTL